MSPLEKHLLVTVSEDLNALFGLRYVFGFFTKRELTRLTLFYVAPRSGGAPRVPVFLPEDAARVGEGHRKPPHALAVARDWLVNMGFPPERVELKSSRAKLGTVKDIVAEAEDGLYDAVVLGRRALTWLDEVFGGSVSHGLLGEHIGFPVWMCRDSLRDRKNVLLCMDDSEQALRAADHVGFMLQDEPGHRVTIFHATSPGASDADRVADLMANAREILTRNGIAEDRIDSLVESSKDTSKRIVQLAGEGRYAAVAVGRRGLASFFGSTSQKLLRNLEGAALWVSK